MAKISGITITLYEEQETGKDPFGNPILTKVPVEVENVLVG